VAIKVGVPIYINQFKHSQDKTTALVVVYLATMEDELAAFKVDPVEIAQMQWVTKDTWASFEFYPEYRMALSKYFTTV
jgi:hypothetical protein